MHFGKVWGSTEPLIETPFVSVHRLQILPNARCSEHCHKRKHNAFYVESGTLRIVVKKNGYDLTDTTVLGPGDFTTVAPDEYHWFETGDQPVVGLEFYYPDPLSEDIVRRNCGAVKASI